MENNFKSIIDNSKSILILLPTKPYFDQVAAGLSLYLSLRDKVNVQVYSPSPMTVEFNRLVGVNKIAQEMGNKNLIIKFSGYKANDIERVSYDIEDGEFKLTVIPKPKNTPPDKDQVNLLYSGVSADTVIMVGGANESHFPSISEKDLADANLVHIGTKELSLSGEKKYVTFSKPVSSASEIVFGLIKESGLTLDEDMSTNLLMGIEAGSEAFAGEGVSAYTFAAVAELMQKGGKRITQTGQQEGYPPGAIPGQQMQQPQPSQSPQDQQSQPQQQSVKDDAGDDSDDKEKKDDKAEAPQEWMEPKI